MKQKWQWLPAAALGMGLALMGTRCLADPSSAQFDLMQHSEAQGTNVTVTAKIWIKGDKVRMEAKNPLSGDFLLISDGKDVYQMNPAQKMGQKRPAPSANGKPISPWRLVTTDVNQFRSKGKRVGRETIEGVPCDVYSASESKGGSSSSFKAWIATVEGASVPMKVMAKHTMTKPGASMSQTQLLTITHLKTNIPVADSQFVVPKDYKISTGSPVPPMSGIPHPGMAHPGKP